MLYNRRMEKLLLHCCCAPCSLGALPRLVDDYAVTLFYYNPCIMAGEYEKRLSALKTVSEVYRVPLISEPHDYEGYLDMVKGHESDGECGARCEICIGSRIERAAIVAAAQGFDVFTTTLSVSPKKNYAFIKDCGVRAGAQSDVRFLDVDFKKKDGFLLSVKLSRELGIYRQNFCGCEFSYDNRG